MTSPMLPRDSYWPFPSSPASIAADAADRAAHPFYVEDTTDRWPYGDDWMDESPVEGPCYFATIGDAAERARAISAMHGVPTIVRENVTDPEGYPDPADPAVQYVAAPAPLEYGVCVDGGVLVTADNCRDWIRTDPYEPAAPLALAYLDANPALGGDALFSDPAAAIAFATALKRAYGHDELVTIVLWPQGA